LENNEITLISGNCCKLRIYVGQKMGWATFWVIFSQTHLVALPISQRQLEFQAGLQFTNKILICLPWRRGAVDIASASGTRRPGSNPARV
jgi:hypothetical protein